MLHKRKQNNLTLSKQTTRKCVKPVNGDEACGYVVCCLILLKWKQVAQVSVENGKQVEG